MSLARRSAFHAAPIPLRLLLAATFLWTGLGKSIGEMPVQGEKAALLANMGYQFPQTPADPPAEDAAAEPDQTEPGERQPPEPAEDARPPGASEPPPPEPDEPEPAPSPGTTPPAEGERADPEPDNAITYTASDFPEPVEVKRVYGIALLTYNAAHPAPDENGEVPPPIWPEWAARDHWPITLAWTTAIVEIVAGLLVLIGLLTRFAAVALAAVMATAMWLTQFGPAVQSGDALLGFLPNHDIWNPEPWKTLFWQLSLFASAITLALAGSGALAIDRAGGRKHDDFDDEDDEDTA